jgi:hypothetical protein
MPYGHWPLYKWRVTLPFIKGFNKGIEAIKRTSAPYNLRVFENGLLRRVRFYLRPLKRVSL